MDNNETVAKKITSLLDLVKQTPKTIAMQVNYGDDLIEFEIEILSHYEWMELDHSVPFPERIKEGMTANGVKYDYNHPEYQLALRKRTTWVQLKRIARCIQASIPGDDNEAQTKWLSENFDFGMLSAIALRLQELHTEGEATVIHRSESFHSTGTAAVASNGKVPTNT